MKKFRKYSALLGGLLLSGVLLYGSYIAQDSKAEVIEPTSSEVTYSESPEHTVTPTAKPTVIPTVKPTVAPTPTPKPTLSPKQIKRLRKKKAEERKRRLWEKEKRKCLNAPENVPNWEKGCISSAKSYMGYHTVTDRTSRQYKLLRSNKCYTDPKTGIRMVGDRYCIAVGTYYTKKIGTKIDVVMYNGKIFKCILGEVKSDWDTDKKRQYCVHDGTVVEFIVDTNVFTSIKKLKGIKGDITKIVVLD